MIKIALIDDHQIVRSGFAQLLNLEPDLQVVAEFGSASDALAGLPGSGARVCVCDISMPDQSGLDLLKQLPSGLAVVMLSVHDSPALIEQALQTGAKGFLSKRCSPDELIAAVRTAAQGVLSDAGHRPETGQQQPGSPHQSGAGDCPVTGTGAGGEGHRRAAWTLPKTVHVHRANLMDKLKVSNNVELAHRMLDSW